MGSQKATLQQGPSHDPLDIGFEFKHCQKDPKGGELYPPTVKSWETVMEAGNDANVQIAH